MWTPPSHRHPLLSALGTGVIAMVLAGGQSAPTPQEATEAAVVHLKSRSLRLTPETTDTFLAALAAGERPYRHGLAHFRRPPDPSDARRLDERGIAVLYSVIRSVYQVRVAKTANPADSVVADLVSAIALLRPEDKVQPDIWNGRFERFSQPTAEGATSNSVVLPDGQLLLAVRFYPLLPDTSIASLLSLHSSEYERLSDDFWLAVVPQAELPELAGEDLVRWIDALLGRVSSNNDPLLLALGVSGLQNVNTTTGWAAGLAGSDVQIAQFDLGIDQSHDDFLLIGASGVQPTSRVVVDDVNSDVASWHGTVVAGTIAGSGLMSSGTDSWNQGNGGGSFAWRGVAPRATLIDVPITNSSLQITTQTVAKLYSPTLKHLIEDRSADLANHSYSRSQDAGGKYSIWTELADGQIRGDHVIAGEPLPRRLQVHSAGNSGWTPEYPSESGQTGYFALGKQHKNALIVGAFAYSQGRVLASSSLGPTYDGRIKPDAVAPSTVTAAAYCNTNVPANDPDPYPCASPPAGMTPPRHDFYFQAAGTSTAAAAVSGILALVLEEYARVNSLDIDVEPPLPSTLRALIIHSARDVAASPFVNSEGLPVKTFRGPDFTTGFGLVDAKAAVNVVRSRRIVEGTIPGTCITHVYDLFVPFAPTGRRPYEPPDSIKVTLAWDDPPASAALDYYSTNKPLLRNDLDLVLIDPTGGRHYPWLLNQRVTNAYRTELDPEDQLCGKPVRVGRRLRPDLVSGTSDVINPLYLGPATTGKDHLNNVEQVVAPAIPGLWKAVVVGFLLDVSPQDYSLIGPTPRPMIVIDLGRICRWFPAFCELQAHRFGSFFGKNDRYQVTPIAGDTLVAIFKPQRDQLIFTLPELCFHFRGPETCQNSSGRLPIEVRIGLTARLEFDVFDSTGDEASQPERFERGTRFVVNPQPGETYFVVIRRTGATEALGEYRLPISIRQAGRR